MPISDLPTLLASMQPILQEGDYVFCTVQDLSNIPRELTICEFKEQEGTTLVLSKTEADRLGLTYDYVAAWITLLVHSALEAVGLTAAFATELGQHNISANVVAGYYHDHIFVAKADGERAVKVLNELAKRSRISS